MRIVHRITEARSAEVVRELAALGVESGTEHPITFEVAEDDRRWPLVEAWIRRREPLDFVYTTFSPVEIEAASWLELVPDWHFGYPEPRDHFPASTYDLSAYCEDCGVGLVQRAPFMLRGEPRWGTRSVLQLNWVFDEYFVRPELWRTLFKPRGVDYQAVIDRKHRPLATVVQLVIRDRVHIVTEGLAGERCPRCGRSKYAPVKRGRFPALLSTPRSALARTAEYFGSGRNAYNGVVVHPGLASELRAGRFTGVSYRPVAERSTSEER